MYAELMGIVRGLFPSFSAETQITLEGIPQLFTREKLRAIKDAGMNRISMGVQQINERLNRLSGRKQTTRHVVQTLDWAREFGLSANVDLIFGWPQQTVQTMVRDLETLISWGVYDITHYELNVGGPSDFALNRYHELPSTLSNLEMYRVSRDLLKSHGFQQLTAYNWRKPGDPTGSRYAEAVLRGFDGLDTIGLGYAGITFFGNAAIEGGGESPTADGGTADAEVEASASAGPSAGGSSCNVAGRERGRVFEAGLAIVLAACMSRRRAVTARAAASPRR